VDGIPVTPGPLRFIQEGNIGLRHVCMNILQPHIHRAHGYREVFEAGEEIEEVVRGEGKFSRFDGLRREFQGTK
jgi:hypothetical protein